VRQPNNKAS